MFLKVVLGKHFHLKECHHDSMFMYITGPQALTELLFIHNDIYFGALSAHSSVGRYVMIVLKTHRHTKYRKLSRATIIALWSLISLSLW